MKKALFRVLMTMVFGLFLAACGGGSSGETSGGGGAPAPTANIWVDNTSILEGGATRIHWATSGGIATGSWSAGDLPASGYADIAPADNTTYTVICTASDGRMDTDNTRVVVTPVWETPADYLPRHVVTNGTSTVVRLGGKPDGASYKAVAIYYNINGTTHFENDNSALVSKSTITSGSLYTVKSVPVLAPGGIITESYDIYIGRFNLTDGAPVGSLLFIGNSLENPSIASDPGGVYVSLVIDQSNSRIMKADLALSSSSAVVTIAGAIENIFISGGNLYVSGAGGTGNVNAMVMAYTTAGIPLWTNPQTYNPEPGATFNHGTAVGASGGYVYMSGYTLNFGSSGSYPPFLRKYNAANGSFVSAVALPMGTAWEMAFGPTGNIYVAMASGAKGPVALDAAGNILWTGTDECHELVYFQGLIITPESVYDATTGEKLF